MFAAFIRSIAIPDSISDDLGNFDERSIVDLSKPTSISFGSDGGIYYRRGDVRVQCHQEYEEALIKIFNPITDTGTEDFVKLSVGAIIGLLKGILRSWRFSRHGVSHTDITGNIATLIEQNEHFFVDALLNRNRELSLQKIRELINYLDKALKEMQIYNSPAYENVQKLAKYIMENFDRTNRTPRVENVLQNNENELIRQIFENKNTPWF